ncbi:arsenate reductase (azurin) small subunit [Meiothermus granaticius]|uniref:Arsenite oxidase subunit AioB n=1 Tax=Meiothermus granaticius NBRC 107808 TaxID=1227551 RepID=A0A399F1X8_9DEIN|nr:arsenate reductase (azurin) small subunit [Meiothermus granaticius]RIH90744.1 Arsenite oxidase subunit AioB [Meiothermus granaticius NBRC 107808]GEM88531.1 arsenite oxidase small subunit [Meiothermus granaticius NBRC 107808]
MMVTRRRAIQILSGVTVASVTGVGKAQWGFAPSLSYPAIRVGNIRTLQNNQPLYFAYPDSRAQAILIKLGRPALGGVGQNRDIVAFSATCTHMGCGVQYKGGRLVCPCHYSMFDPTKAAQVYQGLASTGLPRIRLRIAQNGDILANAMEGLIWGRTKNV